MIDFLISFLFDPFLNYTFMRRALAVCAILAVCGAPLGVFMTLRRMTLVGDAMSHAILPGVSLAFMVFGLSLWPMTLGGLLMGILVALVAVLLTRLTRLKEDASFAMLFLLSLAAGVVLVSLRGSNLDLLHLLFGDILGVDGEALYLVLGVGCFSVFMMAFFYRGMVISCFDPDFASASRLGRGGIELVFFLLLIINLIAAFQALGTLMALGLMILPAITVRFWTRTIDAAIPLSLCCALIAAPTGLLASYYTDVPAGPAVVLVAGSMAFFSALIGRYGSLFSAFKEGRTSLYRRRFIS